MSKQLLPLFLSVKAINWRMHDESSMDADLEFQSVRKKALARDDHTCRFCGFRAVKWQEVHHFNDDHADNRLENLVTACTYCHMCQHIGLAGAKNEAILIYRPELTQVQINNMVRTAQVVERMHDQMKAEESGMRRAHHNLGFVTRALEGIRSTMASLKASAEGARLHYLTSDPTDLANSLLMLPDEVYAKRRERLAGLRLLPLGVRMHGSENKMPEMVDAWRSGSYRHLEPNTWASLARNFA